MHSSGSPGNYIDSVVEIRGTGRKVPLAIAHRLSSSTLPNDNKQVRSKNNGIFLRGNEEALLLRLCGENIGIVYGNWKGFRKPLGDIPSSAGQPGMPGDPGSILSIRYVPLRGRDARRPSNQPTVFARVSWVIHSARPTVTWTEN